MAENSRPLLITIIGALVALLGIITIVGGIFPIIAGEVLGGIIFVAFGIITLIIAIGMLKGITIMWYLGLIFESIGVILNLISVISGDLSSVISLVIGVVIIYYLFRPAVKAWFKV